jgi:replicative DNA helicase
MKESAQLVEEAILGGIMLWDGPWPNEVLSLEPEYFRDHTRAKIFEAMEALIAARSVVDEITVIAQLDEWNSGVKSAYVLSLAANAPTCVNLPYWANLLVEDGLNRAVRRQVADALSRIGEGDKVDDVVAGVRDSIRNIKPRFDRGPVLVRESIKPTLAQLEMENSDPEQACIATTGIGDLDRMAQLRAGHLTIIAARPSMGKSALATNIAEKCGRDITRGAVVMFSLEMDTISLVRRMMSSRSGYNSDSLPKKAASGELVDTCGKLYDLNMYIDDRPGISIDDVRSALTKVGDVRLVLFDYLQLAKLDKKAERHDLALGALTKGFKSIAKEFDCHAIGLSQLNRSVEKRTPSIPKMSDLRDSGNIEEDADNVWFLYRPVYYDKKQPEHEAHILVDKQRNGRTGVVKAYWDGPTQTFRQATKFDIDEWGAVEDEHESGK